MCGGPRITPPPSLAVALRPWEPTPGSALPPRARQRPPPQPLRASGKNRRALVSVPAVATEHPLHLCPPVLPPLPPRGVCVTQGPGARLPRGLRGAPRTRRTCRLSSGLGTSGLARGTGEWRKLPPTAGTGEWQVVMSRRTALCPPLLCSGPSYCASQPFPASGSGPGGCAPRAATPLVAAKGQLCFLVWSFYPAASWPSAGQDTDGDFTPTGGNSLYRRGVGYNQICLPLGTYLLHKLIFLANVAFYRYQL